MPELRFRYEEEPNAEEFFCPFVWELALHHAACRFYSPAVKLVRQVRRLVPPHPGTVRLRTTNLSSPHVGAGSLHLRLRYRGRRVSPTPFFLSCRLLGPSTLAVARALCTLSPTVAFPVCVTRSPPGGRPG
jgi:hypothetical protein